MTLYPRTFAICISALAADSSDNSVMLPFPIWRESFLNDADLELRPVLTSSCHL